LREVTKDQAYIFTDPKADGIIKVANFLSPEELSDVNLEVNDPSKVFWRNSHETFVNKRGLTVTQNYDAFGLKLSKGDQTIYERLDAIHRARVKTQTFVRGLRGVLPHLINWAPDELSIHRYDKKLGISRHKDHADYIGVIALLALQGKCGFAIYRGPITSIYPSEPGDLLLMRATGVDGTTKDMRPEHAVIEISTRTRTSMMLRANLDPMQVLPKFNFANLA